MKCPACNCPVYTYPYNVTDKAARIYMCSRAECTYRMYIYREVPSVKRDSSSAPLSEESPSAGSGASETHGDPD